MKVEFHKLSKMWVIIPTIGLDTEYKCAFIDWLNRALYVGKGKQKQLEKTLQQIAEEECNRMMDEKICYPDDIYEFYKAGYKKAMEE